MRSHLEALKLRNNYGIFSTMNGKDTYAGLIERERERVEIRIELSQWSGEFFVVIFFNLFLIPVHNQQNFSTSGKVRNFHDEDKIIIDKAEKPSRIDRRIRAAPSVGIE